MEFLYPFVGMTKYIGEEVCICSNMLLCRTTLRCHSSLVNPDPRPVGSKVPEACLTHRSGVTPPDPSHCSEAGEMWVLSYYFGKW